ncbi:hypothetical protein SS50377_20174 [Spironucleus salmonicida]|uniref:Uncharacterized protein n=1 Tax=Spironucleus salmonicida TaxID=348837 RepID=V6LWQ7_9EUKA|nr:hypothetical protein SS50377_20174 [Spironucleus salmonicida]|eukprot:EST45229.1 hypothetical protein SS50377_14804 [Spironucleus salmonicida]
MIPRDCIAYFPGEFVAIVQDKLTLGRIMPPFERNINNGEDLSYSVFIVSTKQVVDVTVQCIVPFNYLAIRGLPYTTSNYRIFFEDFIQMFYDNFDIIRQTIYIPNIPFPLGNYIRDQNDCRDFLAAAIPSPYEVKNKLKTLEQITKQNENFFQQDIKPQKQFQVSSNKIISLGDVISLNKQYYLVKRIFAIKKYPYDNVLLEVEVLANNQHDKYTLVGLSIQIPLIYEFQVFQTKLKIEDADKKIILPLQFYNSQEQIENPEKLIIDYLIPHDHIAFAKLAANPIMSNSFQSLDFQVRQFSSDAVFDIQNVPVFSEAQTTTPPPKSSKFLSAEDNKLQLLESPPAQYPCKICNAQISENLLFIDQAESDLFALAYFLNKFGGAFHCLKCNSVCHQNCIFQHQAKYQIQFNELVCGGYSLCCVNGNCQFCNDTPNYFGEQKLDFWQNFIRKNYYFNEEYDVISEIQLQQLGDKTLVHQFSNFLNNWHMHRIDSNLEIQNADEEVMKRFMNVSINDKEFENCKVNFGSLKSQFGVIRASLVQNCHYTQEFLVNFMGCIDSFLNKQSNLLFWLQVWYTENDFVEFEQIEGDKVEQVIIDRFRGDIGSKIVKKEAVKAEIIQPKTKQQNKQMQQKLVIPTIDFTEKVIKESQEASLKLSQVNLLKQHPLQYPINVSQQQVQKVTLNSQSIPSVSSGVSQFNLSKPVMLNMSQNIPPKMPQSPPTFSQKDQHELQNQTQLLQNNQQHLPQKLVSQQQQAASQTIINNTNHNPVQQDVSDQSINSDIRFPSDFITVQTNTDEAGQLSTAQYSKIYSDVREQYENTLVQDQQSGPVFVPPQVQKVTKITQPFELGTDVQAIKSGIQVSLDIIKSSNLVGDLVSQIEQGDKPSYDLHIPQYQSEPPQKLTITDTENFISKVINNQTLSLEDLPYFCKTLQNLQKALPIHQNQYPQILPNFPSSATLQKLLIQSNIQELESQAENLACKDNSLNLKANETISTIESIRIAFSELKSKLQMLAQELQDTQNEKQITQYQLQENALKQQNLAKKFCDINKDVDQAVFSDFVHLQKLKQLVCGAVVESLK